jgi:hypothetical protein
METIQLLQLKLNKYIRNNQKYQFFVRDTVLFPVNITVYSAWNIKEDLTLSNGETNVYSCNRQ